MTSETPTVLASTNLQTLSPPEALEAQGPLVEAGQEGREQDLFLGNMRREEMAMKPLPHFFLRLGAEEGQGPKNSHC